MKKVVLIVAGGEGQRMNAKIPKQFQELKGLPILMHSINAFVEYDKDIRIILVLHPKYHTHWDRLCDSHDYRIKHEITFGGPSRFHSVKNGLGVISDDCLVAVHDSVRPLVSRETIASVYYNAEEFGNAVPCVPLNESIRKSVDGDNTSKNRADFVVIQTPQCFQSDILKTAYNQEPKDSFTDDASIVEASGEKIHLVDGNPENIKITLPKDFLIATALLNTA